MITEEQKKFLDYWKYNRLREKKTFRQWLIGLPIGLAFSIPILISFTSGWYKRANMWARSQSGSSFGVVLAIAFCVIITFVAIFYKKHQWDMREQQYQELLAKMTHLERQDFDQDRLLKSSE